MEDRRSEIERHTDGREGEGNESNVHLAGGCTSWGNNNRVYIPTPRRALSLYEVHHDEQCNNCLDKKSND